MTLACVGGSANWGSYGRDARDPRASSTNHDPSASLVPDPDPDAPNKLNTLLFHFHAGC